MNRRAFLGAWTGATTLQAAGKAIRLSRLDGRPAAIDWAASEVTVLLFLSTVCPISNAYSDRIKGLVARYAGKPVRILLVNSNDNETVDEVRSYAKDVASPVPIFKDWSNVVADRFDARMTPEAVVVDKAGEVRYQGAIDDAKNPARVKVEAVRLTVDALLAKQPTEIGRIRSFGCTIKRVRKEP